MNSNSRTQADKDVVQRREAVHGSTDGSWTTAKNILESSEQQLMEQQPRQPTATRRAFMAGTAAAALGFAGCSGNNDQDPDTTPTQDDTTTTTEEFTGYEAENIQESGEINLVPADEEADYANSGIFQRFNATGENAIDVRIDLDKAYNQRHYQQDKAQLDEVKTFVENIQDPEWRRDLLDQREEKYDKEIESFFDWDKFADTSKDFETRVKDSGLMRFWAMYERGHVGDPGVSSTNNDVKAAAFQSIERLVEGSDVFIWDYKVDGKGGHGNVGAIENPARQNEPRDQQKTYIIETNPRERQQIEDDESSDYFNDNTVLGEKYEHPAEKDFNGEDWYKEAFYEQVARGKDERDLQGVVEVASSEIDKFTDFFQDETEHYGQELIDQAIAAYYIGEENHGNVHLGEGKLEFQTA